MQLLRSTNIGRAGRRLTFLTSLAATAILLAAGLTQSASAAAATPSYYLALGDSLSVGYMPGSGNTNSGYTDDLYAALHAKDPSLQLVKLGCSGETSTSMIKGGECSYAAGDQLDAATQFLAAHWGHVKYLTLDIGANDVDKCAATGKIDLTCAWAGLQNIGFNTATILTKLRYAAGWSTQFVGMNYYDPFLAAWLQGSDGQSTAQLSSLLTLLLNTGQSAEYRLAGAKVADVAGAFQTYNYFQQTTLPGVGSVPVNVGLICQYTFMCTKQNIHPTVAGYQLMATAFATQLGVTIS